jgi:hypothetical protein
MSEVEQLLRLALVPVEPSEGLSDRLERRLSELRDAAVEELADWELSAMRDPRNWARPLAALIVSGLAGGALFVVRARHGRRRRLGGLRGVERGARDAVAGIERRLRR